MASTSTVVVFSYLSGLFTLPFIIVIGLLYLWLTAPNNNKESHVIALSDTTESNERCSGEYATSSSVEAAGTPAGLRKRGIVENNSARTHANLPQGLLALESENDNCPYAKKKIGWLKITKSPGGNGPPTIYGDSYPSSSGGPKLTEIVSRSFTRWMESRKHNNKKTKDDDKTSSSSSVSTQDSQRQQRDSSYYVVLERDTLVMYDSERMVECRGVIIVSKYRVSLYHPGKTVKESQVYSRRNPIQLSPVSPMDVSGAKGPLRQSCDYYVYVDRTTDKEDWYFALLWSSLIDVENEIDAYNSVVSEESGESKADTIGDNEIKNTSGNFSSITTAVKDPDIHRLMMRRKYMAPDTDGIESIMENITERSLELQLDKGVTEHRDITEGSWLNAIIGRIFLGAYRTSWMRDYMIRKIQTKFDRVNKPAFIDSLMVTDLEVGSNVPIISNPKLVSFDKSGQLDINMDVEYKGGFRFSLRTGVKFGSIKMPIEMVVELEHLVGSVLVRFKPAPTNRFWVGFYEMPNVGLNLSPIVMQKQVRYTRILQAIERQIYDMVRTTLVLPNMDDTVFFPSNGEGAIFESAMYEFAKSSSTTTADDSVTIMDPLEKEKEQEPDNAVCGSNSTSTDPSIATGGTAYDGGGGGGVSTKDSPTEEHSMNMDTPAELSSSMHDLNHNTVYSGQTSLFDAARELPTKSNTSHQSMRTAIMLSDDGRDTPMSSHESLSIHERDTGKKVSPAQSTLGFGAATFNKEKAASIKSAITNSTVSLIKRARDSNMAESAKTWWQKKGKGDGFHSPSSVVSGHRPISASFALSDGHLSDDEDDVVFSDASQSASVKPMRNSVHVFPRISEPTTATSEYELPLLATSSSGISRTAGGVVPGPNASASGIQFPRVTEGTRHVDMGGEIRLPMQRRYSKGNKFNQGM